MAGLRAAAASALALAALACAPEGDRDGEGPSPAFERARARGAAPEREWRSYLGDRAVSHASPLSQIDRGNVAQLEVAWTYDAGDVGPVGFSQIQFNPLVVKGVLYGCSPSLRLFALDAATGEELWSFQPDTAVELWTTSRGAAYWEDGEDERLFFGAGPFLHALDARTGRPIRTFGADGVLDLREALDRDVSHDIMGVVATTPGVVFEDLLIVGGRVNEMDGAAPGHVRAFDVRTGERRWIFHTIPQPGELGADTWPADAWERAGGANAWAGFSVDVERGLVFVPTGSATPDFFGAERLGDNLFANSLLALDARTGRRVWHYQLVRHDIWDRDLPAPPNLVEIERGGARIPAVAQVTKTGHTFLFHRQTGEPLFPLREEPVAGVAVAGERPAASQPLPTRPPPVVRQRFGPELVTDRTPAVQAQMRARVAELNFGSLYVPTSVAGTVMYPGTDGGAEWGGAAWDAETGLLFVNANQVAAILQMVELPAEEDGSALATGYLFGCAGCHGLDMQGDGVFVPSLLTVDERLGFRDVYRVIRDGRGRMPGMGGMLRWYEIAALAWFVHGAEPEDAPQSWARSDRGGSGRFANAGYRKLLDAEGLPGTKPPWGTLTALDLSRGEIRWQLPFGDYPQVLAAGRSGLGAENYGGPVVTAGGLLFIAATPDAQLRAFDKHSGALLWQAELPAAGFATPATYEADGRQFVAIAAGGGKLDTVAGSKYVAFALPVGR